MLPLSSEPRLRPVHALAQTRSQVHFHAVCTRLSQLLDGVLSTQCMGVKLGLSH
jgi:hypothetical protein